MNRTGISLSCAAWKESVDRLRSGRSQETGQTRCGIEVAALNSGLPGSSRSWALKRGGSKDIGGTCHGAGCSFIGELASGSARRGVNSSGVNSSGINKGSRKTSKKASKKAAKLVVKQANDCPDQDSFQD